MAFHAEHYNVLLNNLAPIQCAMLLPVRLSPGCIKQIHYQSNKRSGCRCSCSHNRCNGPGAALGRIYIDQGCDQANGRIY